MADMEECPVQDEMDQNKTEYTKTKYERKIGL